MNQTLGNFKKAVQGRKLFVWVNWAREDGEYFPMSVSAFLRSIGADVPHSRDGLHNDTFIDFTISKVDNHVYVG